MKPMYSRRVKLQDPRSSPYCGKPVLHVRPKFEVFKEQRFLYEVWTQDNRSFWTKYFKCANHVSNENIFLSTKLLRCPPKRELWKRIQKRDLVRNERLYWNPKKSNFRSKYCHVFISLYIWNALKWNALFLWENKIIWFDSLNRFL